MEMEFGIMKKKKPLCSVEELKNLIAESFSLAEVMRKLDSLGYYSRREWLREQIQINQLDTQHFTGALWNKGKHNSDTFSENHASKIHYSTLLSMRPHQCENCGLTEWLNQPIPLEVHHKDGNRLNNSLENLQLLCPNCHSLTDNYKGKNIKDKGKEKVLEEDFKQALISSKNIRQALIKLGLTPKGLNYSRAYNLAIKYDIKHLLEH